MRLSNTVLILQHDKLLKLHIGKLSKEGFQLASGTNHFKFEAPDGKDAKSGCVGCRRDKDHLSPKLLLLLIDHEPRNKC